MIDCKSIKIYSNIEYISKDIPYSIYDRIEDVIFKYLSILKVCNIIEIGVYDMNDVINNEYEFDNINRCSIFKELHEYKFGIFIDIKTIN